MSGPITFVLRVIDGPDQGRQAPVARAATVGRGDTELSLSAPRVSRAHARVTAQDGHAVLADLASRHGTWRNGQPITGPCPLRPGDTFRVDPDTIMLLSADPPRPRAASPAAQLVINEPGMPARHHSLSGQRVRIGRDRTHCDIVLDRDFTVSAVHCEITSTVGQLEVRDLGSAHGVLLNDAPVTVSAPLRPGDRLAVGRSTLTVTSTAASAPPPVPPLDVLVREEGTSARSWAVTITATPTATVADLIAALTGYLGLASTRISAPSRTGWCVYRERDARLLDPALPWAAAEVRRADTLVLGPLVGDGPPPPFSAPAEEADRPPWRTALRGLPRSPVTVLPHPVRPPQAPAPMSWRGRGVLWQIAGGLGMLVVGLGMAFINPLFLVFALLGGVAALWGIFAGLLGERSRAKAATADFRARLAALDAELTAVRDRQSADLHRALPPAAELAAWPQGGHRELWQRRPADPDFLALRLGVGIRPALLDVDTFALRSTATPTPLTAEVDALLARHATLPAAPLAVPATSGVLGITGDRDAATALARALLVQAAALHSPAGLPMAVLNADDTHAWTRWLPHVEDPDGPRAAYDPQAAAALAERLRPALASEHHGSGRVPRPRMLLFADTTAAALPPVRALLDAVAASGTALAIVLGPRDALPTTTTLLVECRGDRARTLGATSGTTPFAVEGLDFEQAARFAAALAPYTDADPARRETGSTSASVAAGTSLLALLNIADPAEVDPVARWVADPTVPVGAPVGVTDAGEVLNLSMLDGPHGLIAGTTGSGKSEFLQSFLAGIAATHSPERVAFFLVDFKGGATFTEIVRLPHVVGAVTNLDGALAQRAVTSLRAELVRRQEMLAAARIKEFLDYRPDPPAGRPPLPRLLLVIDEFAMLAAELPDVMDRFVDIATVGRSLGVHMLLATQSPSGVVSGKVEANTNLRLCLRVATAQESNDVLGRRDAADIGRDQPGRGFLRYGGGSDILGFQTARIAGPYRPTRNSGGMGQASRVQVAPFADQRPAPAPQPHRPAEPDETGPSGPGRTELDVLTETIAARTAELALPAGHRLWLPPLPETLPAADLPPLPEASEAGQFRERPDLRVRLGLADEPERVAQPLAVADLAVSGHLLVLGAYASGKTTALRQIAAELAARNRPDRLHVYGIDAGDGSLASLLPTPHVGDVVGADDLERLSRLIARLDRLVAERRSGPRRTSPATMLLVDDFAAFRETADNYAYGTLLDRLVSLVRSGPAAGLHVVLAAAQRTDLPSSLLNLLPFRVLLRQTDSIDYDLVGAPPASRPKAAPPGRALISGTPFREAQIAVPDPHAFAFPGATALPSAGALPRRVPGFPDQVHLTDVLNGTGAAPDGTVAFGVGGPELEPVGFDFAADGPHLVVTGSARSGRSTALLALASSLRATKPDARLIVLAPRRSPLRDLPTSTGSPEDVVVASSPEEITAALAGLTGAAPGSLSGTVLLVDDAESLPDTATLGLEPLLRAARDTGLWTVFAVRSADFARSFDGWARYLRSLRALLLLAPRPEDGELAGGRLPPAAGVASRPGRGLLYATGEPAQTQVAVPDLITPAPQ